ncbi:unnamed protein product [Ilex paraguariensis]|uniref:DUF2921 domain-containing protein n=1 Tax=Ilex paraguariensis TaxID=185542 RepID=A0ABC8SB51_9AQUA
MKTQCLIISLWTLLELFGFSWAVSGEEFVFPNEPSVVYTYNRFVEIEKQCSSFLSSASELKPDDSRGYRLKNELSFFDGDWEQEIGGAPLMPFDNSDMPRDSVSLTSLRKLVSFEVNDVNSVYQFKNTKSIHLRTSIVEVEIIESNDAPLSVSGEEFVFPNEPSVVYTYNRFVEIEKQCSSFLSSASELKPDDSRGYRLKNELSFFDGDWEQEIGGAPLMPFDNSDMPRDSVSLTSLRKLVSFEVNDVNSVYQFKNTVSLNGVLSVGISRNGSFLPESYAKFQMSPYMSALQINFQGVYMEIEENGGQHLTCLLGNSTLPIGNYDDYFSDLTNTFGGTYYHEILLLSPQTKYLFSPEELKSRTCNPSPLQKEMVEDGVKMFDGPEFCKVLRHLANEVYDVAPQWRFGSGNDDLSRLGPSCLSGRLRLLIGVMTVLGSLCRMSCVNRKQLKMRTKTQWFLQYLEYFLPPWKNMRQHGGLVSRA